MKARGNSLNLVIQYAQEKDVPKIMMTEYKCPDCGSFMIHYRNCFRPYNYYECIRCHFRSDKMPLGIPIHELDLVAIWETMFPLKLQR